MKTLNFQPDDVIIYDVAKILEFCLVCAIDLSGSTRVQNFIKIDH